MHKVKSQQKFDRYARYAFNSPCRWMTIIDLATRHFPKNLRQYASDQIQLRITQMEHTC